MAVQKIPGHFALVCFTCKVCLCIFFTINALMFLIYFNFSKLKKVIMTFFKKSEKKEKEKEKV